MSKKTIIFIVGPTAIGKTSMGVSIAQKYNCPVISADSRQFFKEMSIGTAKPTLEEMQDVKHYFVDSHSITEEYNVGQFESEAITRIEELFKTHDQLVVVGGSGLYINAIINGFDDLPKVKPEVRADLKQLLTEKGITALQKQLQELDPTFYEQVDIQNPQRITRALEICLSTGKPYSSFRKGNKKQRSFQSILIGLNTERERLYANINQRVDEMMANGLEQEVKDLLPHQELNALQTVGYKEVFAYLKGETDLATAIDLVKQNTRRFAKRQLTWFKRDENTQWFEPNEKSKILDCINKQLT